jgi:hypothetical protein
LKKNFCLFQAKKSDQSFVCLFFFCFLILLQQACENKILSKNNIFFSRVFFYHQTSTPQITQIKKEREQKHLRERERERERKRAADAWKRRKSFAFGHK